MRRASELENFEEPRGTHAAADAHGHHHVLGSTTTALDQRVSHTACRDTQAMTTTIKVSNEVRDQLKSQAALAHRTLGQHLEYLVRLGEREARMASLRAAVKATSPEELVSYGEETRAWDRVENG